MQSKKSAGTVAIFIAACSALYVGSASAETFRNGQSFWGTPTSGVTTARVVDLTKEKAVRVAHGETVTFRNQEGKQFTWTFDALDMRSVSLSKIAPSGFDSQRTKVYVGRNPVNRG